MLGVLNGVATVLALMTFVGIVWWAWSRGRQQDNYDASMLPFALPDEQPTSQHQGGSNE